MYIFLIVLKKSSNKARHEYLLEMFCRLIESANLIIEMTVRGSRHAWDAKMNSDIRDRYFARNTVGISAVEVFWGIGLPIIIESTFLQLFLKSLGASNRTIGLIPAIMGTGIALFSLPAAYFTAHLVHKRRAVMLTHIMTCMPIFLFGAYLFTTVNTAHTVTVFLALYALGSLGLGLTIPVWQNFTVKIFSEEKTIPALAVMLICQTAAKLAGSVLILKFVQEFSFDPSGTGIVFMALGALFFIGTLFFLFVREVGVEEGATIKDAHDIKTLSRAIAATLHNRNFLLYLAGSVESLTCIMIISFYAIYAAEYYSIPGSIAAGLFLAAINAAGILVIILFGWFNILTLKNKLIAARLFSLCGVACLLVARSLPFFMAASFLLGGSRAISSLCHSPSVKMLSGMNDATDYFSVSQVFTLPMSFGIPFAAGLFLDRYAAWGAASYRVLFGIGGALILASLACVFLIDFDDNK